MTCNVNITQLDATQAFKRAFDCEHDSIRVIPATNSETEIEISAEDGDSVEAVARSRTGVEMACGDLRAVCLYASAPEPRQQSEVKLLVSPDESGNDWYEIYRMTFPTTVCSAVIDICAKRLKIEADAQVTVKVVGRS
jgi:hypothetical protein